ncbi:MAG: SEL1-like repeat protein [Kiritimatiellae bacterium]|nr:SEL1-like repeat protein [Kiritimatiellia bacterium]
MFIKKQVRFIGLIAVCFCISLQATPAEPEERDFTPEFVAQCKAKAEGGDAEAQAIYGRALSNGWGVETNYQAAINWLQKAAMAGNAIGQCNLGACYEKGTGVAKDEAKAVEWYQKAAEQGLPRAQFYLGACYKKGTGVAKDETKAVEWYQKAAEQGLPHAQCDLGSCYAQGRGVDKNWSKAVEWCRKAAEQGFAFAQCYLGLFYESGRGVEKDETKAVEWYRKAAEQGLSFAQFYLGVCYESGRGVEKDETKAVEWYRKAAEQGFAEGQFKLGACYEKGTGVAKDETKAVEWCRKAAEQGLAFAQFYLGVCYESGKGVEKDETKAIEWYRKAAEQGNDSAKGRLSTLSERIAAKTDAERLPECRSLLAKATELRKLINQTGDLKLFVQSVTSFGIKKDMELSPVSQYAAGVGCGVCYFMEYSVDNLSPIQKFNQAVVWLGMANSKGVEEAKESLKELLRIKRYKEVKTSKIDPQNMPVEFFGFYPGMPKQVFTTLCEAYGIWLDKNDYKEDPSTKKIYSISLSFYDLRTLLGAEAGDSEQEIKEHVMSYFRSMKPVSDVIFVEVGLDDPNPNIIYTDSKKRTACINTFGLDLNDIVLKDKVEKEKEEREQNAAKDTEKAADKAIVQLASQMIFIPGKDIYMSKFEVTQALWLAVVGNNPSKTKGAYRPVENVDFDDIRGFLDKLNTISEIRAAGFRYRLPTADEWEFACRAGSNKDGVEVFGRLPNGEDITRNNIGEVAWYDGNSGGETHPVGEKRPNAFGLYDMNGNVCEWTSTSGRKGRIICGGSYQDNVLFLGASMRNEVIIGSLCPLVTYGFRLVAEKGDQ